MASIGLVPRKRVHGLRLTATDQDWGFGVGEAVEGASEALALALVGRAAALDDLSGPGLGAATATRSSARRLTRSSDRVHDLRDRPAAGARATTSVLRC